MNIVLILASLLLLIVFSSLHRGKRAKNKVIHVIDSNCTGCRRCMKSCRHNALEIVNDEARVCIIVKYPGKCTACGNCVAACKFNALELINRKQEEQPILT